MKTDVLYTPSGKAGEYADHGYAVNLYTGCPHGCAYCYAPDVRHMQRDVFHNAASARIAILQRLEKDLQKVGNLDEPIFLCFVCDPYPPEEKGIRLTREAIQLIKSSGNNVRILTKNGDLARRDFHLLDCNDEFGVTLTCLTNQASMRWEPKAGTPTERMQALLAAKDAGIQTWVSFEPVLYPEWTLELIRQIARDCDIVKVGKLNYASRLPGELRREVEGTDWRRFAIEVRNLLKSLGCNYVIKKDLAVYLTEEES